MRLSEVSRPRVGVYPYGPHGPGAAAAGSITGGR